MANSTAAKNLPRSDNFFVIESSPARHWRPVVSWHGEGKGAIANSKFLAVEKLSNLLLFCRNIVSRKCIILG